MSIWKFYPTSIDNNKKSLINILLLRYLYYRPTGFADKEQVDAQDDMMPTSDSDSDNSDLDTCNPNRRPNVPINELTSSDEEEG